MKILLAQIETDLRERIDSLIRRGGFEPVPADLSLTPPDHLEDESFDLAVFDSRSGEFDILDVCRGLKAHSGGFLPVVVIGEGSSALAKIRALESGADDYLSFPFDERELLSRIRTLLRTKRMHDEVRHLAAVQEQIVYTISHDLQTPLVGIRGAVHNLLNGLVGPISDDQREYLEMVGDSARRLSELTTSMCRSARRRVEGSAAPGPVELDEAVEAAVAGLRPAIVRKGLNLNVDKAPDAWAARGERTGLIRVFANLLDNATKHSPEHGNIWVTIRGDSERPDWIHVLFEDEGPGVPEEEREKVFARPSGMRSTQGTRTSNSGLGLAVCKETIEAFGGRIWLEGDPGKGARFHLVLPGIAPVRGVV